MRAKLLFSVAVLTSIAAAAFAQTPAPAAPQTPAGLWQAVDDDTKQPTGWFLIANHDGVYSGIIAKMFLKPGEDPNAVCSECKDDRLNHPWLGLEIIRGMKQDPDKPEKYEDGTILDPRDGKIYKANMTVTPDGQTLVVRGYIGISLLGKNQYLSRLPDSDMAQLDPSVNPNPPVAAPAPPPAPARKPPTTAPATAPNEGPAPLGAEGWRSWRHSTC
ncbi:MAG: DUF2147 domain-containing protein, partial [Xanthobacteraceae bacterium]